MRFLSFASVVTLATCVTAAPNTKVKSYDGYQVFRVNTHGHSDAVQDKLSAVTHQEWEHAATHIDVVVAPDNISAFKKLGLESKVLHKDLGQSITVEGADSETKWKRQADDLSWYDSYHNYEDHIQYFNDLQKSFPNQSEIVSSGRSYQNRNIFGLHLWGADGPGKPAVIYHGTVHAREWISTTVSLIQDPMVTGQTPDVRDRN